MKRKIPLQLRNPDFRFILTYPDSKIPVEKGYTDKNNYPFSDIKILKHIHCGGNIALLAGHGGLIVIDFDSEIYQNQKEGLMPKTFVCKSAQKGLKHFYYMLEGNMIKSQKFEACDDCRNFVPLSRAKSGSFCNECRKWVIPETFLDIKAGNFPITCPPSAINGKNYEIIENSAIALITAQKLKEIFKFAFREPKSRFKRAKIDYSPDSGKVQEMISILIRSGVNRKGKLRFCCPFHESNGKGGNLAVFEGGSAYCFHCERRFADASDFQESYNEFKKHHGG